MSSGFLVIALSNIAAEMDKELTVYGGDRDAGRNAEVGGAPRSSHLDGTGADVIFAGTTKAETRDLLQASTIRKAFGVRLLYHQDGSTLPEHSHLDLQTGGDITEQKKGSKPKYVSLPEKKP